MGTSISPRLPQELSDAIIDHFQDDHPALSSYALVNKAWLDYARHHIFRRILARHHPQIPGVSFKSKSEFGFLTDIIALGDGITNLVREIYLTKTTVDLPTSTKTLLTKSFLVTLLKSFPNLSSLILEKVELGSDFDPATFGSLIATPGSIPPSTSLHKLILLDCSSTAGQLEQLLQLAPYIHDLQVSNHEYFAPTSSHMATLATAISRLPLEILCVEGVSWFDPFIYQEISWPPLQILKATIFCNNETEDLDTLNNILASPASSIRHLYVRLATPLYGNDAIYIPSTLQSLSICIPWPNAGMMQQFGLMLRSLQRCPPSCDLKHIDIQIMNYKYDPADLLESFPWAALDKALGDLKKLEQVSFCRGTLIEEGKFLDALRKRIRVPLPDSWNTSLMRDLPSISERLEFL